MKPLMLTHTGKEINPLNLRPEDIAIEDIAHALSMCNRFGGHTIVPLNVAQHSVYVSKLVAQHPDSDDVMALQGLLHDGSEAYWGDIIKWIKGTAPFAPYREIEETIQHLIYRKFGCSELMHPIVAQADKLMLRFEGEMGFGYHTWEKWLTNYTGYSVVTPEEGLKIGSWVPWHWPVAEAAFLDRYRELTEPAPVGGQNSSRSSP